MERKLYVTNIPLHYEKHQLEALFTPYGVVVSVSLITDAEGNSKGLGFVRVMGDEAAIASIAALNGADVEGFEIGVGHKPPKGGWNSPRERRKSA